MDENNWFDELIAVDSRGYNDPLVPTRDNSIVIPNFNPRNDSLVRIRERGILPPVLNDHAEKNELNSFGSFLDVHIVKILIGFVSLLVSIFIYIKS